MNPENLFVVKCDTVMGTEILLPYFHFVTTNRH